MRKIKFIDFPVYSDERGHLAVIEGAYLSFEVKRVFYIYGVPQGEKRASHAHRLCRQLLVAVAGSFTVMIEGKRFVLESPSRGLYLPPMVWRELHDFSPGAICLVLCSEPYDEADYIRDFDEYNPVQAILG
jgi:glyoxylate utilization-related uncharacterized protein